MLAENWDTVQDIFSAGLELPERERERLLSECRPDIAETVKDLWAAHGRAGTFLATAAIRIPDSGDGKSAAQEDEALGVIGPYRLTRELGRGGMGAVYLGVRADGQFSQEVAIKLIKRGLDTDEIVRRFRSERQILAGLEHPGIARLLDGGSTQDGRPYLVLERVQGERIDTWCQNQALGRRARIKLFLRVCDAVAYAHRQLVVHRDIKPGNILVTADGGPKLLDFGVAKMLQTTPEATYSIIVAFTPEYASPEQIGGGPITTLTDVYSLGVVLYELLSGGRPQATPLPFARDRDLDTVLLKALRPEPEERYGSVEQFSADLERWLNDQPVLARPSTRRYRAKKFIARHKAGVAAATGIGVLLAGSSGFALWEARVARRERALADQRSNDTRNLANALLFRLYDEVQGLPGAMKAREDLIVEGMKYLDKLSAAAGNDLTLRYELAVGYRRLATLQGDPLFASKGNRTAAEATLKKAIALQESIVAAAPNHAQARLFLAVLYDDASRVAATQAEGHELSRRSVDLAREGAARFPTPDNRMQLAIALLHDSAHNMTPDTVAIATAELEESDGLMHKLAAEGMSTGEFRAQHAFVHKRLGAIVGFQKRDYAGGARHYREALAIDEGLLQEHPERDDLRYNLTFALNDLALLDMQAGRLDDALAGAERALRIREAIFAADPTNKRAEQGIASTCQTLAQVLIQQKRFEAALGYGQRSVSILAPGPEQARAPSSELAWAYWRIADAYLGWAKALPARATDHLDAAAHYYTLVSEIYGELAKRGKLAIADAEAKKAVPGVLAEIESLRRH